MKAITLLLGTVGLLVPAIACAAEPVIRLYPAGQIWAYELEAARGLHSAVIQNTAVINLSANDLTVETVRFDVLRDHDVVLSRTLHTADLDRAAKTGSALKASGMLDVLDFQFAPAKLLAGASDLAATRTLAPGQALYIPVQVLAFTGKPQQVRITVDYAGTAADTRTTVPLRFGAVEARFLLPLQGRWVAGAGSTLHSHHRWAVPEEFAFDFVRYGASGGTYAGDGAKVTDYYAYGAPVLASADGEVVASVDTMPDSTDAMRRPGEALADYQQRLVAQQGERLAAGAGTLAGNHVVIRHGEALYSVYGHLKPGSVGVAVGQNVVAGQAIGAVGTSGNSTEPHLHFHVCDAPDPLKCVGMPVRFENIEIPFSETPRQVQSGDVVETLPLPR